MTFAIRPAVASDQRVITALVRQAGINPMSIHWEHFLVAEDRGRIISIGQVKTHQDGSRELASIATVPDRQQEGLATAIIQALLARELGTLYLTCRAPTCPFYARFGFRRIERIADMPPYFRRLMRIANVLFNVTRLFGRDAGGWVMVREGK
jgi:N-acetylglutamate synthase-like GNAT family acetyltransferase